MMMMMMMMMMVFLFTGKARNSETLLSYQPQTCLGLKKNMVVILGHTRSSGVRSSRLFLFSLTQPVVVSTVGIFYQTAGFCFVHIASM